MHPLIQHPEVNGHFMKGIPWFQQFCKKENLAFYEIMITFHVWIWKFHEIPPKEPKSINKTSKTTWDPLDSGSWILGISCWSCFETSRVNRKPFWQQKMSVISRWVQKVVHIKEVLWQSITGITSKKHILIDSCVSLSVLIWVLLEKTMENQHYWKWQKKAPNIKL